MRRHCLQESAKSQMGPQNGHNKDPKHKKGGGFYRVLISPFGSGTEALWFGRQSQQLRDHMSAYSCLRRLLLGLCCASGACGLVVPLSATKPAAALAGLTLPRASSGEKVDLGGALSSSSGKTLLVLGTCTQAHF